MRCHRSAPLDSSVAVDEKSISRGAPVFRPLDVAKGFQKCFLLVVPASDLGEFRGETVGVAFGPEVVMPEPNEVERVFAAVCRVHILKRGY